MERFENTNPKIVLEEETEQFVEYDVRGKAVVLQKNAEHPGKPFSSTESADLHSLSVKGESSPLTVLPPLPSSDVETQFAEAHVKLPSHFRASKPAGGRVHLFRNVKEASAVLAQKMALNRG